MRGGDGTVFLEDHATAAYRREPDGSHTRVPGLQCLLTLPAGTWRVEVVGAAGQRGTGTIVIPESGTETGTTSIPIR